MAQTILGVFRDESSAERAIAELKNEGFSAQDISIVMKDKLAQERVVKNTGASALSGAVSGATTGGVLGGLAGLLIGIGAVAVPGIGGLLIGGPIAVAMGLGGAAATTVSGAVTGALAGGLVGALVGLGIPETEAKIYETEIKQGAILVAIPVSVDKEARVREALENHGATQIRSVKMVE